MPPPHHYFPAHVTLIAEEADKATVKLLSAAGKSGARAFLAAWGMELMDGKLYFTEAADPLRQVRLVQAPE
jgi:hypothetical protein